jgi:hypothetical protein
MESDNPDIKKQKENFYVDFFVWIPAGVYPERSRMGGNDKTSSMASLLMGK